MTVAPSGKFSQRGPCGHKGTPISLPRGSTHAIARVERPLWNRGTANEAPTPKNDRIVTKTDASKLLTRFQGRKLIFDDGLIMGEMFTDIVAGTCSG